MLDGPAHCALKTLWPLPSIVIDLYLNETVLVVATQCQGASLWRRPAELDANAPMPVSFMNFKIKLVNKAVKRLVSLH